MVASRKVRKVVCCMVRIPEHPEQSLRHSLASGSPARVHQTRPSDLLPWADPYITQLVRNLQHEVRHERSENHRQAVMKTPTKAAPPMNPLERPSPHRDRDWQWPSQTATRVETRWHSRNNTT